MALLLNYKCSMKILQRFEEFFVRDLGLFKDAAKRRSLDGAVRCDSTLEIAKLFSQLDELIFSGKGEIPRASNLNSR